MTNFLVLTVIADDKPGIVEQLSAVIARHGGNWLESRMATYGRQICRYSAHQR